MTRLEAILKALGDLLEATGADLNGKAPAHGHTVTLPTIEMVDAMLNQVGLDRVTSGYWKGVAHAETLEHVEVWLHSLRDQLESQR